MNIAEYTKTVQERLKVVTDGFGNIGGSIKLYADDLIRNIVSVSAETPLPQNIQEVTFVTVAVCLDMLCVRFGIEPPRLQELIGKLECTEEEALAILQQPKVSKEWLN